MSMSVFRMLQLHQRLDDEIRGEQRRIFPDIFRLQKLKRHKLAIKDRLARMGLGQRARRTA